MVHICIISLYCNYFYDLDTLASKAAVARAKRLLGTELIGKGEQVVEGQDLRKTCFIIAFGDYEAEEWCPGLTFIYKYSC